MTQIILFFFNMISSAAMTPRLIRITIRYPYFASNSGMVVKFIPYHPVMTVRGKRWRSEW